MSEDFTAEMEMDWTDWDGWLGSLADLDEEALEQ